MENNELNEQEKKVEETNKKNSFVPGYASKDSKSNSGEARINIPKKKRRNFSIIWIIIIIIVLLIAGLAIYKYIDYLSYKKYSEFDNKVKIYGFDRMYDNSSANISEKVTKSEAVKLIVSSVLNIYDIKEYYNMSNQSYDNEIWVEYAKSKEWLPIDINKENADEKATVIDCLNILSRIKTKYLSKSIDDDETPSYSDFENYTNDEKNVIRDMVGNSILIDDSSKLNAYKPIRKGQLNSLLVNYVEKYNLITVDGQKLNINDEKLPYNAEEYPYIIASVNKAIYQKKLTITDAQKAILPVDFYADNKEQYISIKYIIEGYFNALLNINYNTITRESFKDAISESLFFIPDDKSIDEYIKYVKDNKISTLGSAKVIYPVIYFDGQLIRVRTYLSFIINSGDTHKNIFYGDLGKPTEYVYNDEENMYIDMTLKMDEATKVIRIVPNSIKELDIGNINISK